MVALCSLGVGRIGWYQYAGDRLACYGSMFDKERVAKGDRIGVTSVFGETNIDGQTCYCGNCAALYSHKDYIQLESDFRAIKAR